MAACMTRPFASSIAKTRDDSRPLETSLCVRLGQSALECLGEQAMEMMAGDFASDAETAAAIGAAPEAALDFLADSHVFPLNLVRDRDAIGHEFLGARAVP